MVGRIASLPPWGHWLLALWLTGPWQCSPAGTAAGDSAPRPTLAPPERALVAGPGDTEHARSGHPTARLPVGGKGREDPLMVSAAKAGDIATVRVLLAGGEGVDGPGSHRRTALMYAASTGDPDLVRLLLDAGAEVGARDRSGNTALFVMPPTDDTGTIELLLARGAGVNDRNKEDHTPLRSAAYLGRVRRPGTFAPGRSKGRCRACKRKVRTGGGAVQRPPGRRRRPARRRGESQPGPTRRQDACSPACRARQDRSAGLDPRPWGGCQRARSEG